MPLPLLGLVFVVLAPAFPSSWVPATACAAEAQLSAGKSDAQLLIGRWVRPDGGYVLEVKEIRKDGTTVAAYFNPRPINVGRAEVSRKDGALAVFVELRDVNYPGSQYDLRYDPASDQLIGSYFQAVESQYYTVGFVRVR